MIVGTKSQPEFNKGISVWDAMHPNVDVAGNSQSKSRISSKSPSGKVETLQNIRRDPIGYFEDTKFGINPVHTQNQNGQLNGYLPSWKSLEDNQYENSKANELLENQIKYQ